MAIEDFLARVFKRKETKILVRNSPEIRLVYEQVLRSKHAVDALMSLIQKLMKVKSQEYLAQHRLLIFHYMQEAL